ncbi:MAG: hypothetical protein M1820_009570 [Bogoriella megaspora]|nr:MAG: hypothetical protein M1820_009570 [Bogoriella megaspora]
MATPDHCVLLLNLPEAALGGIDLLSFTTTTRFQGIKHIPSGLHFIFTSPTTDISVRHGAWFFVGDEDEITPFLAIKKWDSSKEELIAETDEVAILRWRANLGSLWKDRLTPYQQTTTEASKGSKDTADISHTWRTLTSHITDSTLSRITGGSNNHWDLTSGSSAVADIEHIPGHSEFDEFLRPDKELEFLLINLKRTWREGATGRERTDAARDRSWALNDLIARYGGEDHEFEILAELQFCFLMVLTLNNNSCLEQWKRILGLMFTCRSAVIQRTDLFVDLLLTLKTQLEHSKGAEGGLFDLSEEGGAQLQKWLFDFKRGLEESGAAKGDVFDELEELEDFIRAEFGWDLASDFLRKGVVQLQDGENVEVEYDDEIEELGEYAPTVVDLTPDQRETFLASSGAFPESRNGKACEETDQYASMVDDLTPDQINSLMGSTDGRSISMRTIPIPSGEVEGKAPNDEVEDGLEVDGIEDMEWRY